ncbi:hypothetical protein [Metarhizobium album]|nr:hypothetical protein [Rhizobium album]
MKTRIWLWIGAVMMGIGFFTVPGSIVSLVFPVGATIIFLVLLRIERT